jgi:hypothetical protein
MLIVKLVAAPAPVPPPAFINALVSAPIPAAAAAAASPSKDPPPPTTKAHLEAELAAHTKIGESLDKLIAAVEKTNDILARIQKKLETRIEQAKAAAPSAPPGGASPFKP